MSIALVRVAEVPMQECFKRRERPADARFPFVDDLFGLVEFQQPDMGEPRRQKNVRRISGHALGQVKTYADELLAATEAAQ